MRRSGIEPTTFNARTSPRCLRGGPRRSLYTLTLHLLSLLPAPQTFFLFNISEKSRLFWVEPERQRAREREREEEGFVGAMATEFATTKEACDEAQVPQVWRDACAHLLIPLNACRKKEFYLPWKYVNTNTTLML